MATIMGLAFSIMSCSTPAMPRRTDRAVRRTPWRCHGGRTTDSDVFLFSFMLSKTQYSTDVVYKACEPGRFSCDNLVMH